MEQSKPLPTCLVLMGTYNGEKYLSEQINSILNQKDVKIYLKIADDRSTDNTVQILKNYKSIYSNFEFYINDVNKNFTYNFIDLLFSEKESKYDYYAFADQDDYWNENKIINAIKKIESSNKKNNRGCLYFSNQNVVDSSLNFIKKTYAKYPTVNNKYIYLCENIATGCTFVFDQKFKNHFCSYYPNNIYLHDNYMFLVSIFSANYIYDHEAYIDYRQHSNNQIGVKKDHTSIIRKFKNFKKLKNNQSILVQQLIKGFYDYINDNDKKQLFIIANYRLKITCKLKLLFSFKIRPKTNFLNHKIKILFNKY